MSINKMLFMDSMSPLFVEIYLFLISLSCFSFCADLCHGVILCLQGKISSLVLKRWRGRCFGSSFMWPLMWPRLTSLPRPPSVCILTSTRSSLTFSSLLTNSTLFLQTKLPPSPLLLRPSSRLEPPKLTLTNLPAHHQHLKEVTMFLQWTKITLLRRSE